MKKTTIKWRIFKYNFIVIILLILTVAITFNIAGRAYMRNEIIGQLDKISEKGENAIFEQAPKLMDGHGRPGPPNGTNSGNKNIQPSSGSTNTDNAQSNSEVTNLDPFRPDPSKMDPSFDFFMRVNRSIKDPLSILNAEYFLLDKDKNQVLNFEAGIYTPDEIINYIKGKIIAESSVPKSQNLEFKSGGTQYIATIKHVTEANPVNLEWIVVYSSLDKVNQMQYTINFILLAILLVIAALVIIVSSALSKKLSSPFSAINEHIKTMTERKFDSKISLEADDEFLELVTNINLMSEKLETYDNAQKTFLQNVSHEFRTPLMSIQSYAEGITYGVVDTKSAVDVIIDEVKRLTKLVEDLLYLSRLEAIEENYSFNDYNLNEIIKNCIERLNGIAIKNNIKINYTDISSDIRIVADEEKLFRAINNILSNCIRYAETNVTIEGKLISRDKIEIRIKDDGPGFDENDLANLFERFYKGKKGNFGLGLAISKSVVTKHHGEISAQNYEHGAMFKIVLPLKG